jgi:acyl-CoA thioesterase FadM
MEFEKTYEVRIGDINAGNHFSHDKILGIMHDARCFFFKSLELPVFLELNKEELSLIETSLSAKDIGIVINDLSIKYLSEIHFPDRLKVKITVSDINNISFLMHYDVINIETNKLCIQANTKLVSFDYKKRRASKIGENFLLKLKEYIKNDNVK